MPHELKLPELGENITQGTVTKILVQIGDSVKKGQNILEMETDKAVLEVPAKTDGVISAILIQTGAVVKIGQPIFLLNNNAQVPIAPTTKSVATPAATTIPVINTTSTTEPHVPGAVIEMPLPVLGENIEKGTVTKILVKTGDLVRKGQNILELETDKAVLEVPSPNEGLIKEVMVQSGAIVKIGQIIFKIETGASTALNKPPNPRSPSTTSAIVPKASPIPAASQPASLVAFHMPVRKDVPAAPSVRLFAREIGIDIAQVPGSGPGGRISIADVKVFSKQLNTARATSGPIPTEQKPLPDFAKWGQVRREAMSNVRRKTAEHLSYAWQHIPHVTQFDKANITELEKLRKTNSTTQRKLSITPFLIKLLALGLKKFPSFNASIDMGTNEIIYKDYVNIGVAVDTDRGLLVPVLKNVDTLSVVQISDELTAMAERARLRKTTIEEMQGSCFTVSNLGGIGGAHFTPIVNWPDVAILGISRGVIEPVYTNEQFVPRLMLPLSLSYDHRLIDGADGARFMRWLCEAIQDTSVLESL